MTLTGNHYDSINTCYSFNALLAEIQSNFNFTTLNTFPRLLLVHKIYEFFLKNILFWFFLNCFRLITHRTLNLILTEKDIVW